MRLFLIAISTGAFLADGGPAAGQVTATTGRPPAQGEALLTVDVAGTDGDEGLVRIGIFDASGGFPDSPMDAVVVPALRGKATWTTRLPLGTYAVGVIHDRDGNGELNTNLLGMPRERYGFSNGARGTFGPPSFDDASIVIDRPIVRVRVRVR